MEPVIDDKNEPCGGYILPLEVAEYIKGEIGESEALDRIRAIHGQPWVRFIEDILAVNKAARE